MEYDKSYIHNLESLLYYANKKVEMLSRPYELNINDRTETIKSLKELQEILENYEQPVNIKIKTKKLGRRK